MPTVRPTTCGSPPKRSRKKRWPSTTTGCAPGVRSSSGPRSRPDRRREAEHREIRARDEVGVDGLGLRADREVHRGRPVGEDAGEHGVAGRAAPRTSAATAGSGSRTAVEVRPENGPGASRTTSRRASATGSRRKSTWSMRPKMAAFAPMPRARVTTTTAVKPGFFGERSQGETDVVAQAVHRSSPRPGWRTPCQRVSARGSAICSRRRRARAPRVGRRRPTSGHPARGPRRTASRQPRDVQGIAAAVGDGTPIE